VKERVVVAMSGGVDSSTAAVLLHKQGWEVIGVTLKLPHTDADRRESGCCGVSGVEDARRVAARHGFAYYEVNHVEEFEKLVVEYFLEEYRCGRTPNPCIVCNERVKFGTLLRMAEDLGARRVATGHYARVAYDEESRRHLLKRGVDRERDQSYFLFSLSQEQLSRALFPLGDFTKAEVREMAREWGLHVHGKPQSREICFIPDDDYRRFLRERLPPECTRPGPILDMDGREVGEHGGIPFYTVGQRKGIGAHGRPLYVVRMDPDRNAVYVGDRESVMSRTLRAERVNWIGADPAAGPVRVKAKIRYRHPESDAWLRPAGDGCSAEVIFDRPQWAVTPGQAVVCYRGDEVAAGGWIA